MITDSIPDCDFGTGMLTAACIPMFIGYLVQFIFSFLAAFLLINIIIAGYQIAIGNVIDDKQAGKNRLIWSMIGFTVAAGCYLIVDLILEALVPDPLVP
jgi:hypothetical protein